MMERRVRAACALLAPCAIIATSCRRFIQLNNAIKRRRKCGKRYRLMPKCMRWHGRLFNHSRTHVGINLHKINGAAARAGGDVTRLAEMFGSAISTFSMRTKAKSKLLLSIIALQSPLHRLAGEKLLVGSGGTLLSPLGSQSSMCGGRHVLGSISWVIYTQDNKSIMFPNNLIQFYRQVGSCGRSPSLRRRPIEPKRAEINLPTTLSDEK